MMYRLLTMTVALSVLAAADCAVAQNRGVGVPPRQYRSTTSPYLNLLDTRNSEAFNYYRRYRPEREFRRADTDLELSVQNINRELMTPPQFPQERIRTIGPTGHPTSFRTLSNYFPASGRSGGNSFGRR